MSLILLPLVFILAVLFAVYFTPVARAAALRFGIVDQPDGDLKRHSSPVPYLGGLAVFLAYLLSLGMVLEFDRTLLGILLAGTVTLLVGLVDDFGVLTPLAKLAGQGVAIFALLRSGALVELTEVPEGLKWPLAALWLLAVCNAFNILDVLDGLAAGVAAIAGIGLGVAAAFTGQLALAAAALALSGALTGFVVFNFHPARIYLGDAGSLAVGITLAALALGVRWSDTNPAGFLVPLLIFAVPLADTAYVSVLRARAGRPFWHGSPDHFPLRLKHVLHGDVRRAVSVCYGMAGSGTALGVGALALWQWEATLWTLGGYAAALLVVLGLLARVRMETPP